MKLIAALALFLTGLLPARADTIGKWVVDSGTEGHLFAATRNDSGNMIVHYCLEDGTCAWMLALNTRCDEGHTYPALANSDLGALPLTLRCIGPWADLNVYMFTDFKSLDDTIKAATRIGFAFPMAADEFRVIRFDLSGARVALDKLRERGEAQLRNKSNMSPPSRNTRDQRL